MHTDAAHATAHRSSGLVMKLLHAGLDPDPEDISKTRAGGTEVTKRCSLSDMYPTVKSFKKQNAKS